MSDWPAFFAGLRDRVGDQLGVTDWFSLDQQATDVYAALIADLDPMHNDPTWEGTAEWGGTIVVGTHGLCLLPALLGQHGFPVRGDSGVVFAPVRVERVRFIGPLRVGQRARDRAVLRGLTEEASRSWLIETEHTLEREGEERPFMHAVLGSRFRLAGA